MGEGATETKVKILIWIFLAFAVIFVAGAGVWYYTVSHPGRFIKVHARHILIKVAEGADENAWQESRVKIEKVRGELTAGADFGKLARTYSDCPSKARGGDLGWFGRGQMVEEFEKAAWETECGKVAGPVKTKFGWHLIEVLERR